MMDEHDVVESEVTADVRSEARRAEYAEQFRGAGVGALAFEYAEPPPGLRVSPPARAVASPPKLQHLEDIYSTYPIGRGEFVIRVDRESPKRFNGWAVSGFICDLDEQITTQEFATRFGGGTYSLYVRSFNKDQQGADGQPQQRTVTKVSIEIPGKPILIGPEATMGAVESMSNVHQDHRLAVETMRIQDAREQRASNEQPKLLSTVSELIDRREQAATRPWLERISDLQKECTRLRDAAAASEKEIDRLRRESLDKDRDHTIALTLRESARERDMKAAHDGEVMRLRDEHRREIDAQRVAFESRVEAAKRDYEQRVEAMRNDHAKELQSARDNERNERARIQADAQREGTRIQESFAGQLALAQRELDRVRDEARRRHDEALQMARQSHDTTLTFTKESLMMQLESLRSEAARLSTELSSTKRELEAMRREQFKPAAKQITEARDLLALVTPPQEEGEETPGEGGWKGMISEVGKSLLPAILQGLGPKPGQPVMPGMPGQMQPPPQALPAHHGPPPQMRQHQHAQPQGQRARPRATWLAPQVPPAPGDQVGLPMPSDAPVLSATPRARIQMGSESTVSRAQPPLSGSPQAVQEQQTAAVQPQVQQVQAQEQQAPAPQASMEQIDLAFAQVNDAILKGEPAAGFAKRFVDTIGPVAAAMVIRSTTPDQIVATVQQSPAAQDSIIPTHEGRQYLELLWAEVGKLVQQAGAA